MILYYYDNKYNEYLCIDSNTNQHYLQNFGKDSFEGRATVISGIPSSINTAAIARAYLKENCKRIAKNKVPRIWRYNLMGE